MRGGCGWWGIDKLSAGPGSGSTPVRYGIWGQFLKGSITWFNT